MKKIRILKNGVELYSFNTETDSFDIIVETEIGDDIKQIYKLANVNVFDEKLKLCSGYWDIKYKNMR